MSGLHHSLHSFPLSLVLCLLSLMVEFIGSVFSWWVSREWLYLIVRLCAPKTTHCRLSSFKLILPLTFLSSRHRRKNERLTFRLRSFFVNGFPTASHTHDTLGRCCCFFREMVGKLRISQLYYLYRLFLSITLVSGMLCPGRTVIKLSLFLLLLSKKSWSAAF